MEIDVILCNHAETGENKLYLTGGGVNLCFIGPTPPHVISLGIGNVIHVPYQMTNQPHELKVRLVDEDGQSVRPFLPETPDQAEPVEVRMPFNIGRPPMIAVGDEQTIAVAANFVNLPLEKPGLYTFIIEIDGVEMRRLPFRATTPPPGMMPVLPGVAEPD